VPVLLLAASSSAGQPAGSLNQTKMVFLNTTNLSGKTEVLCACCLLMSVCLDGDSSSMLVWAPSRAIALTKIQQISTSSCSHVAVDQNVQQSPAVHTSRASAAQTATTVYVCVYVKSLFGTVAVMQSDRPITQHTPVQAYVPQYSVTMLQSICYVMRRAVSHCNAAAEAPIRSITPLDDPAQPVATACTVQPVHQAGLASHA
jgi:hypothetical protein